MKPKTIIIYTIVAILFLASGALLLFGGSCTKGGSAEATAAYKPVTLRVWSVHDDPDALQGLFDAYRAKQKNVTIEYRKLLYSEYEKELINALAEDRGPDIFSINNTWVTGYKSKLSPVPASIQLPQKYTTGTIKKEEVTEFVARPVIKPLDVRRDFLDVVAEDVIRTDKVVSGKATVDKEQIYGLPMSVDTMILFYNKDLLNNAGIIEPPKTWEEFQTEVKQITKIDGVSGKILAAGTAMGTSNNVPRSFDLLSLLMMQNGAPMTSGSEATFNLIPRGGDREQLPPGLGALNYYLQFSSPLFEGYSWNENMPDAMQAFEAGQVGFFFGYSYHRDRIRANSSVNFGMATMPQVSPDKKVNYANYWINVVSKKSKSLPYAWDLVMFMANPKNVTTYLDATRKPTALKSNEIINSELNNEDLAVFAGQLLTATSWYRGSDSTTTEKAFTDMVTTALHGTLPPDKAMEQAIDKVTGTLR